MLKDLSALTPPILMAVAFLIAAGAFVRHEMRAARKRADEEGNPDSGSDFEPDEGGNAADQRSVPRTFPDKQEDGSED